MPSSPGPGRVLIALSSGPLVAAPSWTRFDNLGSNVRCVGFDCQSGRQSEFDTTNTGTARVFFHDRNQTLNTDDLVGLQIMLQLYDPVANVWQVRWRGHIDDITRTTNPAAPLSDTEFSCVDLFDYLGGCKFLPGVMGDAGGPVDMVFYEDGPVGSGMLTGRVQKLLDDAGLDPDMYVEFSGNVDLNETEYDSDDVILSALRDAADAEFPGIANVYVDRYGRVVFHGRFARFDPDGVAGDAGPDAWDFQNWIAETESTSVAQIREFSFNRPRSRIINTYVAWPKLNELGKDWPRTGIPAQVVIDTGSIAAYGYHGRDATDLIIQKSSTGPNTGAEECHLFAEFYVANYASPRKNVQTVTFKSVEPTNRRAESTWALMTRIDVSDRLTLTISKEGMADEPFFVEGVQVSCRFLNPDYDMVTVTPNLTPEAYYTDNVFE